MQFQVPQFIQTEDRIVGPLSLKQFSFLIVAGIASVILYFTVTFLLWIALSLVLATLALLLGFYQIEGRPLYRAIFYIFAYYWKPQHYVWQSQDPKRKSEELKRLAPKGSPLENVLLGLFLHNAWKNLQTGAPESPEIKKGEPKATERYEIFRRLSGERRAARRVDYR